MKILQKLFVFQSLITKITKYLLIMIQRIINKFVWQGQRARIKMTTIQQPIKQGGVALPDVLLHHHAAILYHTYSVVEL